MRLVLDIELTSDQLTRLAKRQRQAILTAEEMHEALRDIIARELDQPTPVGWLYAITHYRKEKGAPHGWGVYRHTFGGPGVHRRGRPMLVWDGHQLRSEGGSFGLDSRRFIVDREVKVNGTRRGAR
ncbi:MAG: hypothetical protein ACYSUI_05585 [Planctomycetota bacterium]